MVSSSIVGSKLLHLLGVELALVEFVEKAKLGLVHSGGKLEFYFGNDVVAAVGMKGQAITLLMEGTLGHASKDALKHQVESVLKAYMKAHSTTGAGEYSLGGVVEPFPGIASNCPAVTESEYAPIKVSEGVVHLLDAKAVLQKVHGTSGGSIYYCSAIFKQVKIAIRLKGNALSIRAEGKVAEVENALADLGMQIQVQKNYASVHVEVQDWYVVVKMLGALYARIGLNDLVQVASMESLKEAAL